MYKVKLKLLCNEEELFCTKRVLLDLRITLLLAKLDIIGLIAIKKKYITIIPCKIHCI